MKVHVCLVSDQILANLIPALMEQPEKVILVASNTMRQRGQDVEEYRVTGMGDVKCG